MDPSAPRPSRTHIVLIPGFGGFDALGYMRYYAGITPVLRDWRVEERDDPRRAGAVVHYFDNLPTASVTTRAERLRRYLAKRVARNEIQPDDTIALVGHSTGGLDIRALLWTLADAPRAVCRVDGDAEDAVEVRNEEVLGRVRRVVFLSVPQEGTNIADWVHGHPGPRSLATSALGSAFEASRVRRETSFRQALFSSVSKLADADLLRAMEDALRESDEASFAGKPAEAASAREAFAYLWLWTRNIASDFSAIEDLMCGPAEGGAARFVFSYKERRQKEKELWERHGIATRSYATLGYCPYEPEVLRKRGALTWWNPTTYPEVGLAPGAQARTDWVYRFCYRACTGGPFEMAPGPGTATPFGTQSTRTLEAWENDGIVNTASMLWPDGVDTRLVEGDHADIIGHYRTVQVAPSGGGDAADAPVGRRYHTYDLLRSGSDFGHDRFVAVWRDVLTFCVT
ncbi:esterase/lipase family protein [Polyangium aurulentum]|uniref:esterase/lipase family protein n=1 Tax=Polyangium aurulentum TaxID=2567896 RepID=UPI0010AE0E71|nr:hypothetical protein [Polyangium aurulentum]UQA57982.1 hypothetical protein E8A73_043055 [Polyangium aurulentum]